jgi:hypothetical protein
MFDMFNTHIKEIQKYTSHSHDNVLFITVSGLYVSTTE